ncbi:MAG: hypothetical protein DMF65_06755 [Acidobacteria bacterium]|nr:MAG: hypothetical protein DMF65_06755 [Acidobacteriota bacterium]
MYKKLTRFVPDDHKTALSLASLYEQQGLMVEARQQYLVAAEAYTRAGETREALDVLRRIADLDPTNTQVRLRLADSYARENLPDLAAEAYTEAGERLAARKEFEPALEAFVKALTLRPASHTALHGLLAAHTALGTADDAAEVLEQAVKERPGDLEVRAMLARAYVEAEDAQRAERATHELVTRDPSSFTLFFDVVRLQLRLGSTDDAARLLAWVAELALTGRQAPALVELAQEILARNPEQVEAHRMLVRAYTSLRDEARLRSALEAFVDAAEATGAVEDERRALTRLVRLAPDEPGHRARLEELGGPLLDEEEEAARAAAAELPTFESFMLDDNSTPTPAGPSDAPAPEFEWNSVAEPPRFDADARRPFGRARPRVRVELCRRASARGRRRVLRRPQRSDGRGRRRPGPLRSTAVSRTTAAELSGVRLRRPRAGRGRARRRVARRRRGRRAHAPAGDRERRLLHRAGLRRHRARHARHARATVRPARRD